MRVGILIVGSLMWDKTQGRPEWRIARLNLARAKPVRVPIRYARRSSSRGDTFTMTFVSSEPLGRAILVPCKIEAEDIDQLAEEAQALWKAEQPYAAPGKIGADWGCVGAQFRHGVIEANVIKDWSDYLGRSVREAIPPVGKDGLLGIPWPKTVEGDDASGVDVILATATKAEAEPPTPTGIAEAWIGQEKGHEKYFFENVRYGIRTPDDGEIWSKIWLKKPAWLASVEREYHDEVMLLSSKDESGA